MERDLRPPESQRRGVRPRRRRRVGLLGLVIAVLSLTCATAGAQAATLQAYANGTGTPSGCPTESTTSNGCSLQTALSDAAGGDTVMLATPGASAGGQNYVGTWSISTSGTSAISAVTIDGSGVGDATLDGNGANHNGCSTSSCAGPVLTVGNMFLAIKHLTITNGSNEGAGGAGLDSSAGGTVTITDSAFTDNASGSTGGAIDNNSGGTLTVTSSAFSDNTGTDGGAIDNADGGTGTLSVLDSTFTGNRAGDGQGGAIDSADGGTGDVTIVDSTFTGNSVTVDGGGALATNTEGGSGLAVVIGSTFSGNSSTGWGGAITNGSQQNGAGSATLIIDNSTFSGDSAPDGPEVDNGDHSGSGGLAVYSSTIVPTAAGTAVMNGNNGGTGSVLVAGDLFAGSCVSDAGSFTSQGYNVATNGSCLGGPGDVNAGSVSALDLGSLSENGGATETIPLLGGEAIGVIPSPTSVMFEGSPQQLCGGGVMDQRGDPRPGTGTASCDAGAYETQLPTLYAYAGGTATNSGCPKTTTTADQCSLGTALNLAAAGDTVKLETPGAGAGGANYVGNWVISTSGTSAGSPVTIDGSDVSDATLDGNNGSSSGCSTGACNSAVLTVGNTFLTIHDLTIENSDDTFGGSDLGEGGGLFNNSGGTVTITDSAFTNDAAEVDGGAIDNGDSESGQFPSVSGTVTVSDSTFSGNTATNDGGAIDNADGAHGTVTVIRSTFTGNSTTGLVSSDGGAIDNSDNDGSGTVTVSDSTLAGDFALDGAEIDTSDNGGTGTLALSSSTLFAGDGGGFDVTAGRNGGLGQVFVAGDVFATDCQQNGGTWTDAGYNAGADSSCFGTGVSSDVNAGSAEALHIGSLAPNGGPTDTILLAPDSPAADLIPNPTDVTLNSVHVGLCPGTDQRGDARPGDGKPKCDAGAYETQPAKPTVQITTPADGATYAVNASVQSAYSCAEGTGGPGLVSGATACVGTVADGSPVDTSAPGSHAFTVTATSLDGLTSTVTVHYTVPGHPPADTARPQISGTPEAGQKLSCSTGTWTNSPSSYTYQWSRDGTPLQGATSAGYKVQQLDEGNTLTCSVIASNASGAGTAATSAGVKIPVPHVARCPAATGSLSGTTLGPLKLGMTKAQAQRADKHSSRRGKAYEEFFCLTPTGVRVGYASPKETSSLPKSERARYAGRVIWISTSSAFYAIEGVRVGATVKAAGTHLRLEPVFVVGANDWYLAPAGSAIAVLKVRNDVVQEIGIGDKALNGTRKAQRRFLTSFE